MISGQEVTPSENKILSKVGEQKPIIKGDPQDSRISAKDVAEYSAKMLSELRDLASNADLTFLAYLIQVAYEEAKIQSGDREDEGKDI